MKSVSEPGWAGAVRDSDPGRKIRQSMAELVFRNKPMLDFVFRGVGGRPLEDRLQALLVVEVVPENEIEHRLVAEHVPGRCRHDQEQLAQREARPGTRPARRSRQSSHQD
jgi:hypothetical protein